MVENTQNSFERYIDLFTFYIIFINYATFMGQILIFRPNGVQKTIIPNIYRDIYNNLLYFIRKSDIIIIYQFKKYSIQYFLQKKKEEETSLIMNLRHSPIHNIIPFYFLTELSGPI